MAIVGRLEDFLTTQGAEFRKLSHPEAYTAQEMAAAMHVPGGELAKVVMVKAGKRFIMAVLPANFRVDFGKLRDVLGEAQDRI